MRKRITLIKLIMIMNGIELIKIMTKHNIVCGNSPGLTNGEKLGKVEIIKRMKYSQD